MCMFHIVLIREQYCINEICVHSGEKSKLNLLTRTNGKMRENEKKKTNKFSQLDFTT